MTESVKSTDLIVTQCEELSRLVTTIKKNIEETMATVANDLNEWSLMKKNLEKTSIKGVIILNVGGREFQTSVDTLTREKNTFFTALFSKNWELEKDDKGRVFIDRNGDLFAEILDYMRSPDEFILPEERLRRRLICEARFYKLNSLLEILTEPERKEEERKAQLFADSTLLTKEQNLKLDEFYGTNDQRWQLIYKATRDGFEGATFHRLCNNQGPTMTIIRSTGGYLFGGYASQPWTSNGAYTNAANSFLFLLTNANGSPPTKFLYNNNGNAFMNNGSYGPTFGGGHDLHICDKSNASAGSSCAIGHTYPNTLNLGANTFTGSRDFQTTEIEVFKLA